MRLIHDPQDLGTLAGCVLVPTMGAMHAGHIALIELATSLASRQGGPGCVVSIFVNPAQFNEQGDFDAYPRTLEADALACQKAGVAAVFAPSVKAVYPDSKLQEHLLPQVATEPRLEDAFRPGHLRGVYQVVRRLFEMVKPSSAVFGEKDWQQLQLVRALVAAESMPIEVVPAQTVREADGLALSSRNVHLSPADRAKALSLSRAIRAARKVQDPDLAEKEMERVFREAGVKAEYAVVREDHTLLRRGPGYDSNLQYRALAAASIGPTRLIDNASWPAF